MDVQRASQHDPAIGGREHRCSRRSTEIIAGMAALNSAVVDAYTAEWRAKRAVDRRRKRAVPIAHGGHDTVRRQQPLVFTCLYVVPQKVELFRRQIQLGWIF